MSPRKHFNAVRAWARRDGRELLGGPPQHYKPRHSTGSHEEVGPIAITRTIPDIRSTKIDSMTRFYTELPGFDT